MSKYTVWVGSVEVSDYYLSLENATRLADEWEDGGYNDIIIEEVNNEQE